MKQKIYGYTRVTTNKQKANRQRNNILTAYPTAQIIDEIWTGNPAIQLRFENLLHDAKAEAAEGMQVLIIFDEISRMSDEKESFDLYQDLFNHKIELVFLNEPHINTSIFRKRLEKTIDVDELTGKTIETVLYEYTMDILKEQIQLAFQKSKQKMDYRDKRTSEGLANNGAINKYHIDKDGNKIIEEYGSIARSKLGKKVVHHKSRLAKRIIKQYSEDFDGTLNDIDTMKYAGVSRNTYYKLKKELREEKVAEELEFDKKNCI